MRNRRMLFLVLALLTVCLAAWRLWPRTLEDVLPLSDLESASVTATSTEAMIENNSLKIEGDVQQEEAMVLVYHPANRALLSEIKSYVRENGTKLE